jgi:hypothetical protein
MTEQKYKVKSWSDTEDQWVTRVAVSARAARRAFRKERGLPATVPVESCVTEGTSQIATTRVCLT